MNILNELAAAAKARVAAAKRSRSEQSIRRDAEALGKSGFHFEEALKKEGVSFICECKKASPSKGLIAPDYPYVQIARDYQTAGADCLSVLTEPTRFLGSDRHLSEIAAAVSIPLLRKDFTVDSYMLYEAKTLGASAVLLICAILDVKQISDYIAVCDSLGLSALVEAHDKAEIESACKAGARIIGVNNRNLRDFSVNPENSRALRTYVPEGVLFVAESGIKTRADVAALESVADGVLIGETLMRSPDKTAAINLLRGLL